MNEPEWIEAETALILHQDQLIEHGGAEGIRDQLLESALARPQHLWAYGRPNLAELATAYAFGIARNHPFVDGNKRTAFSVMVLFLSLNGARLKAPEREAVTVMLAVAAGEMDERDFGHWIRANSKS